MPVIAVPPPARVFTYDEVDAPTFYRAITTAKNYRKEEELRSGIIQTINSKWYGACVHVYPAEEYQGMRRILFDSERAGFALKDRDVVSVFRHPECTIRPALDVIIPIAIELGGNRLDCFDRGLPSLYAKSGFLPVARVKFNVEYAPQDWNYERDKQPDIIYMVYKREIAAKKWESAQERDTQIESVISQLNYSTYEEALAIQRQSCTI